jgi:hypothetical protein
LVDQKAAAIQVTGDGHGHREFRNRPFGHRELAPGFRRLKAEGLTSERLTSVAVTRHLELIMPETLLPVSGSPLRCRIVSGGGWQPRVAGGGKYPVLTPSVSYDIHRDCRSGSKGHGWRYDD